MIIIMIICFLKYQQLLRCLIVILDWQDQVMACMVARNKQYLLIIISFINYAVKQASKFRRLLDQ